ncbi:hypothetical protein ABEG17_01920 [Pedococcus sp. KACC 23699]|uniref:DUF202 domain-containing protein n=1 Tax=Pedococcus sp. KACC 23699 TaxID=3149228 RepID=A0AAU7JVA7_9MICO
MSTEKTDPQRKVPRSRGDELARLLGGLSPLDRRMLVAVLATPVVAVGTIWLATELDRPALYFGLPFTVAGFVLGVRAIWRYSREAGDRDLVSGRGRRALMVAAVLTLVGICLPLGLVASG